MSIRFAIKQSLRAILNTEHRRLSKLPRYKPAVTKLKGHTFKIVDATSYLAGVQEVFEEENYRFESTTDSPYIVDVGSNIGLSIVYFKTLYPKAQILGFEPDPDIFSALEANVKSFGYENVSVFQEAVWVDRKGISFQPEGGFSGRIALRSDKGKKLRIKSRAIREILSRQIDFLKMDVEGAETQLIRSAGERLRNAKNIFIEYHSPAAEKQTLDVILKILSAQGFRYQVKASYASKFPFIQREEMMGMDFQADIFAIRSR